MSAHEESRRRSDLTLLVTVALWVAWTAGLVYWWVQSDALGIVEHLPGLMFSLSFASALAAVALFMIALRRHAALRAADDDFITKSR